MRSFTNSLDNIRVASPCSADWEQMFGDERKRFCAECKLNVYNLSDMTRTDAENFLTASEGRVCVRYFRRADGTVLTKDCPVGWRAVKRRVSRVVTAAFSMVIGFVGGMSMLWIADSAVSILPTGDVPPVTHADPIPPIEEPIPIAGEADFSIEAKGEADLGKLRQPKIDDTLKFQILGGI